MSRLADDLENLQRGGVNPTKKMIDPIRIPIHPAFLEADDEVLLPDSYEKATKKSSKKKIEQYEKILKLLNDGEWHKTAEIADNLGLKDTRTKELLKELIALDKLIDNGKTKGKLYRLK